MGADHHGLLATDQAPQHFRLGLPWGIAAERWLPRLAVSKPAHCVICHAQRLS